MEADRYVDAGLAIVPRLTEGPERHSRELALLVARANALLLLKGYSAPETVAALTEAKRLLDAGVGTDLQRFSILYGLCIGNIFAAQMPPARALALQFVEVADQQDDTMYRMVGYRLLGLTQLFSGKNREGLESLQQAERFRDPVRQKLLSHRFGLDPGFAIDYCKIMALMFLGLPDRAAHVRERLLAELPSHGHANTVAVCTLHTIAWPELAFGDLEAAERHFAELLLYCAEKKLEYWRLHVDAWHACARATRAPTKENIAALRNAIEAQRESGARITESFFMSQLAEALLRVGDVPGAEAALQETFAFVEQSGETFWLADSYRVQGRIALCKHEPDRAQAEACFLQAVDVARGQQARLLELRAATSMARLWFDQGKRDEARDLLAPVYNWFTEGFDTLDLKEAKALLKELA